MNGKGGTSRLLGLSRRATTSTSTSTPSRTCRRPHDQRPALPVRALRRAHASFYGVTNVRPGTKQTSSYQECRNLLLSPHAGAEPIPVLEIEANDILRCGHGATAGALDPVQLFYAQIAWPRPSRLSASSCAASSSRWWPHIDSSRSRRAILDALAARIGSTEESAA